jgi:ABC-type multidrug transport system ATPase subunit
MMGVGLVVDRVSVDRGRRPVLTDVSFTLSRGSIVAVVGPNGAGKSSLLEAILGLLPVSDGRVTFDGRMLRDLRDRSAVFSYLPDAAEPPPEVRVGTLLAHAERFGRPPAHLAHDLAERLRVGQLACERAGRLSRGEKRRVSLFAALCTARPVVVLDEPLATFDPLQLLDVLPVLRDRSGAGTALLLSVHQMTDAEKVASQVLVLDGGRVVGFGTLEELRARVGHHRGTLEDVVLELLRVRERHARP